MCLCLIACTYKIFFIILKIVSKIATLMTFLLFFFFYLSVLLAFILQTDEVLFAREKSNTFAEPLLLSQLALNSIVRLVTGIPNVAFNKVLDLAKNVQDLPVGEPSALPILLEIARRYGAAAASEIIKLLQLVEYSEGKAEDNSEPMSLPREDSGNVLPNSVASTTAESTSDGSGNMDSSATKESIHGMVISRGVFSPSLLTREEGFSLCYRLLSTLCACVYVAQACDDSCSDGSPYDEPPVLAAIDNLDKALATIGSLTVQLPPLLEHAAFMLQRACRASMPYPSEVVKQYTAMTAMLVATLAKDSLPAVTSLEHDDGSVEAKLGSHLAVAYTEDADTTSIVDTAMNMGLSFCHAMPYSFLDVWLGMTVPGLDDTLPLAQGSAL